MAEYIFKMPDIGEGVVEAEITAWHVTIGDQVEEDAPIADAMTDKATIELTAPVTGRVKSIGCQAGDVLAVGANLIIFETSDELGSHNGLSDTLTQTSSSSTDAPQTSHYTFKMPDIGEGVVEAEITAWHIKDGDQVEEDAPIADAMTDKATIELTAPVTGRVLSRGCEVGDIIAVGADLVVFETEASSLPQPIEPQPSASTLHTSTPHKTDPHQSKPQPSFQPQRTSSDITSSSKKALAAPAVRRRAKEAGIALDQISPTGRLGHITQNDLAAFSKALEPETGETRIKIIGLRRLIAERMQLAKRHIPHFTYVEEIDVTELEALRRRLNEKRREDQPKLTVLPFIIRALISGLRDYPQMNARYNDEQGFLSQFEPVHLGIATQTDTGLVVPVLKHAETKSVWDVANEISRLAIGAREGRLTKAELTGATTTLTSLGPLGGLVTTPVINRPEVAIFGPNKIRPKLVLDDGIVSERQVMNFSISCDHRIIDGYDAANMVQTIKGLLEDPLLMFIG